MSSCRNRTATYVKSMTRNHVIKLSTSPSELYRMERHYPVYAISNYIRFNIYAIASNSAISRAWLRWTYLFMNKRIARLTLHIQIAIPSEKNQNILVNTEIIEGRRRGKKVKKKKRDIQNSFWWIKYCAHQQRQRQPAAKRNNKITKTKPKKQCLRTPLGRQRRKITIPKY